MTLWKTNWPNETKLAMISQPMNGLSEDDILKTRENLEHIAECDGYKVLNTYFTDDAVKPLGVRCEPLFWLAKSIEAMSMCDAVYFADEWGNARGCVIEHMAAEKYGLKIVDSIVKENDK